MKNPFQKSNTASKATFNKIAFQGGSYSLIITAVVLAILVVVNILVSALPTNLTWFDISSTKLYSITSNTKVVVNALQKDVTIYWIVQSDAEDDVIENLLNKYDSLSEHIEIVKKNPDVYPTFTEQYTSETVANNSLIVECGEKYRYIAYDDIYLSEIDYSSYSYQVTGFDGEGALTSAIDYVTNEEQPKLYMLEGHGEAELPSSFSDQLTKENVKLATLSLLTNDTVPDDADCLMIYSPASDISADEKKILADYTNNGGKLLVMAGPVEDAKLTNLNSLLTDYDIEVVDGIVVEESRDGYAAGRPYALLPYISSSTITDTLIEEGYYIVMPVSQGMIVNNYSEESGITELLVTSDTSFSKQKGFALDTYEKEDGDTDGPFTLGVSIECENSGNIIWYSSSAFLDDSYNSYSSGANLNLVMNSLSALIGESEAMAIRSKSLNYEYLTISTSQGSMLKVIMIGFIPLTYLGIGIHLFVKRRRRQNEAE